MYFIYTLRDVMGVFLILLAVFFALILYAMRGIRAFFDWKKTGFCRHEWKLFSTFGSGSNAEFECKKCKKHSVRHL